MTGFDIFCQFMIFGLGCSAIFLTTFKEHDIRRWAFILGLSSQPFWVYVSFTGQQWGIFFMSFVYLVIWYKGYLTHWTKGD